MESVLSKARRKLLEALLHLLINATLHADARAIIQVAALSALQPYIFSISSFGTHVGFVYFCTMYVVRITIGPN